MNVYVCDKCDKSFKCKTDHTRHLNRKNPCDNDNNECFYCNKTFTRLYSLKKHQKNVK